LRPLSLWRAFALAQNTCLRNNRVWSTHVVNDRVMIVTDVSRNRFRVRMSGFCPGLVQSQFSPIAFRTGTGLGCMRAGDSIVYRSPGLGRQRCFIGNVVQIAGPDRFDSDFDRDRDRDFDRDRGYNGRY
jgi:hypothetical protein